MRSWRLHGKVSADALFCSDNPCRNGRLEAQATRQETLPLQPIRENTFVAPAYGIEIYFNRSESGEIRSLTLSQSGQTITGKRE